MALDALWIILGLWCLYQFAHALVCLWDLAHGNFYEDDD